MRLSYSCSGAASPAGVAFAAAWAVFKLRDGKLVRLEIFASREKAIAPVG
jgi:hypothetical protein